MVESFAIIRWDDDDREEEYSSGSPYIHTPHIASILIDEDVYADAVALDAALQRTFQVCMHLGIPIHLHFRRVHVYDASGPIQDDWALSDLAFYLLLLNGDTHHAAVASAQAYAIRRSFM